MKKKELKAAYEKVLYLIVDLCGNPKIARRIAARAVNEWLVSTEKQHRAPDWKLLQKIAFKVLIEYDPFRRGADTSEDAMFKFYLKNALLQTMEYPSVTDNALIVTMILRNGSLEQTTLLYRTLCGGQSDDSFYYKRFRMLLDDLGMACNGLVPIVRKERNNGNNNKKDIEISPEAIDLTKELQTENKNKGSYMVTRLASEEEVRWIMKFLKHAAPWGVECSHKQSGMWDVASDFVRKLRSDKWPLIHDLLHPECYELLCRKAKVSTEGAPFGSRLVLPIFKPERFVRPILTSGNGCGAKSIGSNTFSQGGTPPTDPSDDRFQKVPYGYFKRQERHRKQAASQAMQVVLESNAPSPECLLLMPSHGSEVILDNVRETDRCIEVRSRDGKLMLARYWPSPEDFVRPSKAWVALAKGHNILFEITPSIPAQKAVDGIACLKARVVYHERGAVLSGLWEKAEDMVAFAWRGLQTVTQQPVLPVILALLTITLAGLFWLERTKAKEAHGQAEQTITNAANQRNNTNNRADEALRQATSKLKEAGIDVSRELLTTSPDQPKEPFDLLILLVQMQNRIIISPAFKGTEREELRSQIARLEEEKAKLQSYIESMQGVAEGPPSAPFITLERVIDTTRMRSGRIEQGGDFYVPQGFNWAEFKLKINPGEAINDESVIYKKGWNGSEQQSLRIGRKSRRGDLIFIQVAAGEMTNGWYLLSFQVQKKDYRGATTRRDIACHLYIKRTP